MADISQITLPSGTTYNLKDAYARSVIESITGGNAIVFKGVSSTALTDNGNENPTVSGTAVTDKHTGDLYFYGKTEFIYGDDNKWHALGDLSSLGSLAYKNSATGSVTATGTVSKPNFTGDAGSVSVSGTPTGNVTISVGTGTTNYQPAGTVSKPTISESANSTTTIKNPTSKTVALTVTTMAPSDTTHPDNNLTYYSVANEVLSLYQLGYTTGASITTSNVSVKKGDASYELSAAPTFTGTAVDLEAQFTGTSTTSTGTFTPTGDVSQPTFSGNAVSVTVS